MKKIGNILFENHSASDIGYPNSTKCTCSYCKKGGVRYGLNIPKSKRKTAWYVIKYWHQKYIRFTIG